MKDMTLYEIAELANVDERSIRRWLEKASDATPGYPGAVPGAWQRLQKAQDEKIPAAFNLQEIIAILISGGRTGLAGVLAENAAKSLPAPKPRLPNGKQLEELRLLHKDKVLSPYQVQLVLGVAVPRVDPFPEVPATQEQGEQAFELMRSRFSRPGLPAGTMEKVTRAAAGAARKTLAKIDAEARVNAKQREFPLAAKR